MAGAEYVVVGKIDRIVDGIGDGTAVALAVGAQVAGPVAVVAVAVAVPIRVAVSTCEHDLRQHGAAAVAAPAAHPPGHLGHEQLRSRPEVPVVILGPEATVAPAITLRNGLRHHLPTQCHMCTSSGDR